MYLYIAIILYFGSMCFLPLLLWPSRRNIRVFAGLPFAFIAYFFGADYFIEMARVNNYPSEDIFDLYTVMLLVSTVLFVVFFCCGYFHQWRLKCRLNHLLDSFEVNYLDCIIRQSHWLACASVIMFLLAFYGMGFIPAFSENPLMAKYGAGEYHEQYQSFAIFYRMGLNLASLAIVLLLLRWGYSKRSYTSVIFFVLVFGCLLLSLRRGMIGGAIFGVLFSYMALQSKLKFVSFFVLYCMVYCLGAAGNEIFFYAIGMRESIDLSSIFLGVPDVADQLLFLGSWVDDRWDYTYGLTWIGGLIPYNFDYNIGAYSLKVIGAQAGEVASGGFRLPVPVIGYISFDWLGLVAFVSSSAYLDGLFLSSMRHRLQDATNKDFMILNVFLLPVFAGVFHSAVTGFLMDQVFVIIVVYFLCLRAKHICARNTKTSVARQSYLHGQ